MILDQISNLRPQLLLDIGCGCGHFTIDLVPYCDEIIIADLSPAIVKRAKEKIGAPNIRAVCMDGLNLGFHNNSVDTVFERFSLHHMANWQKAIDEMIRVADNYIIIEEPVDDDRSQSKRDSVLAWQLYLDIQKEIGYSHFRHIQPGILIDCLQEKGFNFDYKITKSDEPIPFDDFFSEFGRFADKSYRPHYWYDRLGQLKESISDRPLCESDMISIVIKKR
jgi:SAM-dependent methyltransferase